MFSNNWKTEQIGFVIKIVVTSANTSCVKNWPGSYFHSSVCHKKFKCPSEY
jgi:hypothetical protein